MKAGDHVDGIETLFNEALAQLRHGLSPRSPSLANPEPKQSGIEKSSGFVKIPNSFGGYNVFSSGKIEALVIPEQFAKGSSEYLDSAVKVDFTTL